MSNENDREALLRRVNTLTQATKLLTGMKGKKKISLGVLYYTENDRPYPINLPVDVANKIMSDAEHTINLETGHTWNEIKAILNQE